MFVVKASDSISVDGTEIEGFYATTERPGAEEHGGRYEDVSQYIRDTDNEYVFKTDDRDVAERIANDLQAVCAVYNMMAKQPILYTVEEVD